MNLILLCVDSLAVGYNLAKVATRVRIPVDALSDSMKKLLLILLIIAVAGCVQSVGSPFVEYKPVNYKGLPNLGIETYVPMLFQNQRYAEMPLKVYIDKKGGNLTGLHGTAADDVRFAMGSFKNQTNNVISFVEVDDASKADLNVSWVREEEALEPGTSIIGKGGSDSVVNTGLFNLSSRGYVYLSSQEAYCTSRIVHELGHVLGLDHVDNEYDVMYYLINCGRKLSDNATKTFENLYRIEPLPELYFYNISAERVNSNLTLSFAIENAGLLDSGKYKATIEVDGREIQNIDFENLKPGWIQGYYFSYKELGKDYETIRLTIDTQNSIREFDKENNVIVLKRVQ